MSKWLWQWKWALVIAIVAGPAWAYWSYTGRQHIELVMAQGEQIEAAVSRMDVQTHRRGPTEYTLRLGWVDAEGVAQSSQAQVSSEYAERISVGDTITINHVTIKQLAGDSGDPVVVVDAAQEIANKQYDIWFGIIAGIIGLIASPIVFWMERRQANAQEADIDATLAAMRARSGS